MEDIELNTTLMTNMELQECVSHRGGTAVYIVKSTKSEQLYILKHISVPESQKQVDALILTGAAADNEAAQAYYEQVVNDYREELKMMEALADTPNLDGFHSYEIKPKEDTVGFDVFILSERKTTLEMYLADTPMTQASAVNLAIDLCNALSDLRKAGLMHRDVKPGNIFLSEGHFKLGDLGIAKLQDLKYCSIPENMLSPFSAPELFSLMANVNETVDLYAVGLILYRIYNGNHAPFEDEKTSAKAADKLRITGQELPTPMFADYEMAEIIRKATAFQPEERYQTPDEMKQVLVDYMMRNQVGDTPITPPIVADDEPVDADAAAEEIEPFLSEAAQDVDEAFKESFSPDNDMLNALIESVHRDIDNDYTSDDSEESTDKPVPKKRKGFTKWLPTILAVVLVLALVGGAVWYFFIRKDTLTIDSINVTDRTVDSITISLETQENPEKFQVICTDAYGTVVRQDYVPGQPNTFTGLAAGSQYSFSVVGQRGELVDGAVPYNASTKTTTNIISLSVSRETVSEIEITFIPDGTEPKEWAVSYGPAGKEPTTKVFTGHSVVLSGLQPDTAYDIALIDTGDLHLTGSTEVKGHTLSSVDVTGVNAELSDSSAVITWTFEGTAPDSWKVTTTGTEGYTDSQTVSENSITLENLRAGETYTMVITCDNMVKGASASFTPDALSVTELVATPNSNGGVDVSWSCEVDTDDTQWMVAYTLQGSDNMSMVEKTTDQFVTLTGLIPGSKYTIEIQEANGEHVGGETSVEVELPAAEPFKDYNFTTAYMSIWLKPEQEDWTLNNLQYIRNTFKPTESIAFVCESTSGHQDSDDTVTTLVLVRDEQGNVVDHYSGEEVWNNMWTRDKYVGELARTPQEPGKYTIELYFNGRRVTTSQEVSFTITK